MVSRCTATRRTRERYVEEAHLLSSPNPLQLRRLLPDNLTLPLEPFLFLASLSEGDREMNIHHPLCKSLDYLQNRCTMWSVPMLPLSEVSSSPCPAKIGGILCRDSDIVCQVSSAIFPVSDGRLCKSDTTRCSYAPNIRCWNRLSIIRMSLPPSASMQSGMINDLDAHDDRHMPCPLTPGPSRKRRQTEHGSHTSRHKRQKLSQPVPAYWDNLSKIWLTKGALKELDRRNSYLRPPKKYKPVSRRSRCEPKKRKKRRGPKVAPDPLQNRSPEYLKRIKRFSRLGGPDLSDLRNVCDPKSNCAHHC